MPRLKCSSDFSRNYLGRDFSVFPLDSNRWFTYPLFQRLVSLWILFALIYSIYKLFLCLHLDLQKSLPAVKVAVLYFAVKPKTFSLFSFSSKNDHVREILSIIAWIDKTATIKFMFPSVADLACGEFQFFHSSSSWIFLATVPTSFEKLNKAYKACLQNACEWKKFWAPRRKLWILDLIK